jgi:hypothetical protein
MKFTRRNLLIIIGIFLAILLLVDFNRRMEEYDRLTAQVNAVRAEATAVIQTQTALASQVAYASSNSAVEIWAYGNKMVRPGEHPVVVVPGMNTTPTPEPTFQLPNESMSNWQIWWELFFGNRP